MRELMFKTDQKHLLAMKEIDKLILEVRRSPNDTIDTKLKSLN